MMRALSLFVVAATLSLAAAFSGALAAERASLRSQVTATRPVLTVGDFFDNAGSVASRPLFRAPDLGETGTVPAPDVLRRARAAGLVNPASNGLLQITVHRAALTITPDDLRALVRDALMERMGLEDPDALEISYSDNVPNLSADPAALVPVSITRLTRSSRSGRFDAVFAVELGERTASFAVSGFARETAEVVTLARRLARGATVSARDLQTIRVPKATLRNDTITDPAMIIGMALRRPQSPGRLLAPRDFEEPIVVARRSKVIITYRLAGLTLTVQGEAMVDGVKGDVIDVLNTQSNRTVQALVTGPGRVSVQPRPAGRIASLQEATQ
ncbi:flagellar basal body P-ring formation chaperone FlgA [Breoghania sp.]|uniref:flagellar basal body P-ring formation chaperone FlgA n=1 Tax=Breoghania sp. TaxID=2065378 RepID=UPI0029CA11A1|nr:flagellar basal body P-ring formation chaperone FlgA [Breoghania sp.]